MDSNMKNANTTEGRSAKSRSCFICPHFGADGLCYAKTPDPDCVSKIENSENTKLIEEKIEETAEKKPAKKIRRPIVLKQKKEKTSQSVEEKDNISSIESPIKNMKAEKPKKEKVFVSLKNKEYDTSIVDQVDDSVVASHLSDRTEERESVDEIVADIDESLKKRQKRNRASGIEKIDTKHIEKKKRERTEEEESVVAITSDDETFTNKAVKKKKSEIRFYTILSMKREVEKNAENFSVKSVLLTYLLCFGYIGLMSVYYELELPYIAVLGVIALFFAPIIVVSQAKNKNEKGKFEDITNYMNQFSNGMLDKRQVLAALETTYETFEGTSMGNVLRKMIATIVSSKEVEEGEAISLRYIEELYPNSQIKMLHDFSMRIERSGGDFKDELHLLTQRRDRWNKRINHSQSVLKQVLGSTLFMYIVIALICGFIARSMPDMISIVHLWYVEVGETILIAALFFIYAKIQGKMIRGWSNDNSSMSDEEAARGIELLENKDAGKIQVKNYITGLMMFAMGGVAFYYTNFNKLILVAFVLLGLIALFSKKLIYVVTKSRILSEIQYAVPVWLFDVCLLMQKSNISVAITESLQTAPIVLRKEIMRFLIKLRKNPSAVEPYLEFFDNYDLPSVRTTMRILLSINLGTAIDNKAQMAQLIEHNLSTLEELDQRKAESKDAATVRFQYFPMLPLGIVLLTYFIGIISQIFTSMNQYI